MHYNLPMFLMVILAGGESKRMGRDKGLTPFLGVPLAQRVLERVKGAADEVLVVTNHPNEYGRLGVTLITDRLKGRGALGGLYTALSAAKEMEAECVGVVACDMPFVNPALLRVAYCLLLESEADAVVPRSPQGSEPFHAVYRPVTCLPAVQAALDAGKWRVDSWFEQARLRFLWPMEYATYDPWGVSFLNVNTLGELAEAERKARELGETEAGNC